MRDLSPQQLRQLADAFASKGEQVVEVNLRAYDAGRSALRHREVVDEFETFAVT